MSAAKGTASLIDQRFALEALVGSGGMGRIYRARDEHTGRLVALKLLHRTGAARDTDRFVREARILSELHHPGIVTYLTHGQTADGPYIAMEWLDGEDLAARLSRGPLPLADA